MTDEEFNEWYEEEHVPLLSNCPGWLRSTRWQLVNEMDPRTGDYHTDEVASFLACHEWEDADAAYDSAEFRHAVTTPWRTKVMARVDPKAEERRLFQLWRQFLPDGTSVGSVVKQPNLRSWSDINAVPENSK